MTPWWIGLAVVGVVAVTAVMDVRRIGRYRGCHRLCAAHSSDGRWWL